MKTTIQHLLDTLHIYPEMLSNWQCTEIRHSEDASPKIIFTVKTDHYHGRIHITYAPATLYTIRLPDATLTFYGVRNENHVLDVIKDYIDRGEIYL